MQARATNNLIACGPVCVCFFVFVFFFPPLAKQWSCCPGNRVLFDA